MKNYLLAPPSIFLNDQHSRIVGIALFLLLALMPLFITCQAANDKETTVTFFSRSGKQLCRFSVELAVTQEEQTRGLMFRKQMDAHSGMLFVNNEDATRFFWMKNTYIPLDLVFINTGGEVKHVHYGAVPFDETPISSMYPVRYVLEVNAGSAKKCHIDTETRMVVSKKK